MARIVSPGVNRHIQKKVFCANSPWRNCSRMKLPVNPRHTGGNSKIYCSVFVALGLIDDIMCES